MADLDSFFAKKDKKKVKGKKYTTTDEIAKRLEETERKVDKTSSVATTLKKDDVKKHEEVNDSITPVSPTSETEILSTAAESPAVADTEPVPDKIDEDQWNDFKEDEAIDETNLKITKLSIEQEEESRCGQGDGGDDSKDNSGDDKKDGVWKIEEQKSLQSTICEAVDAGIDDGMGDVKATVAAMSANPRWSSQLAKELQPSPLPRGAGAPGSRRKKAAPDITNAMAFPSLADAQANTGRKKNQDDRDGTGGGGDGRRGGGGDQGGGGGLRGLLARQEAGGSSSGAYKPPMMRTSNRFGALTDQSSVMRNS